MTEDKLPMYSVTTEDDGRGYAATKLPFQVWEWLFAGANGGSHVFCERRGVCGEGRFVLARSVGGQLSTEYFRYMWGVVLAECSTQPGVVAEGGRGSRLLVVV